MSHDLAPVERAPIPLRPRETDAGKPGSAPFSNLPRALTSLIGRDADIVAVRTLLVERRLRLITLTGPGGVGKTRLAMQIAHQVASAFPDGVAFVPLAPIADSELMLSAIARVCGLHEIGGQSVADLLVSHLRQRQSLLILDNVEQVTGAAPLVASLLGDCPRLTVLATSRSRLHLSGEHRFPVSPLSLPITPVADGVHPLAAVAAAPAVQLFIERAQAVDPSFTLREGNAQAVTAIARRLDGLPLAIELAAVRMQLLSPAELLSRLEPALPLLTDGPTDAPARLRTMRNAIAWSYDLLSPAAQTLLRRLSVFVGGCTLDAAEAVGGDGPLGLRGRRPAALGGDSPAGFWGGRSCGPQGEEDEEARGDWQALNSSVLSAATPPKGAQGPSPPARSDSPSVLDLIADLVDASLMRRENADGETRLTMLETIREFASERLAASNEQETIATRHASWCVQVAEGVRRSGGLSRHEGLARLESEHPNLRAALSWLLARGEVTTALHLAGELAEFWLRRGYLAEGIAWIDRALAADSGPPSVARANALVGLNMLHWSWAARQQTERATGSELDGFVRAQQLLDKAEAVARAAGDAGALAYTRLHQGYVALFCGDLELAEARGIESLATFAAIPQGLSLHGASWLLAETALARGDNTLAAERFTRLLALARDGRDEVSLANAHAGLARLAERRGEPGTALRGFAEGTVVCRTFGNRLHAALFVDLAAITATAVGLAAYAIRLFAAADSQRFVTGIGAVRSEMQFRRQYEAALRAARATLGEGAFAVHWAAGAALSLDDAIAEIQVLADQVDAAAPTECDARAMTGGPHEQEIRVISIAHSAPEFANGRRRFRDDDWQFPTPLTGRERQVLFLLADGVGDKAIALSLGISRRTASQHVAAILGKMGAESRTAAVSCALREGLLGTIDVV